MNQGKKMTLEICWTRSFLFLLGLYLSDPADEKLVEVVEISLLSISQFLAVEVLSDFVQT